VGHLLQGRFKSILVEKDSYLLEVSRYIVLNPVRAGMVEQPEEYRWSSFRSIIGIETAPDFLKTEMLLAQFGKRRKEAIINYRSFVMKGSGEEFPTVPMHAGLILGSEFFLEKVQERIKTNSELIEIPKIQRYANRESLESLFKSESMKGSARKELIIRAYVRNGYTMKEIADYLGIHYSTVSRVITRLEKQKK